MCAGDPAHVAATPADQLEKDVPTIVPAAAPVPPRSNLPRPRPGARRVLVPSRNPVDVESCQRRTDSGTPRKKSPTWEPPLTPLEPLTPVSPLPPRPQSQATSRRPNTTHRIMRHKTAEFMNRDYKIVQRLGEGSFGKVDLVILCSSGEERVCKVVSTAEMGQKELEQMKEEVRVLRTLNHPHIVKIHEYAEDKDRAELVLILEYIAGGSCGGLLKKRSRQPLPEHIVARFVRQMLEAVAYSHGKGVVHRDLKPEHMMLTKTSMSLSDGVPDIKIIDFGLAARYSGSDMGHSRGLRQRVGTPCYMAPEVVDKATAYTSKADIWSVGVSALELLTGKRPFAGENSKRTYEKIRMYTNLDALLASEGNRLEWHALSSGARDFLRSLLEAEPSRRPTASEALQHAWLGFGLVSLDGTCFKDLRAQSRPLPGHGRSSSMQRTGVSAHTEEPLSPTLSEDHARNRVRRRTDSDAQVATDGRFHLSMLGSKVLTHIAG